MRWRDGYWPDLTEFNEAPILAHGIGNSIDFTVMCLATEGI